MLSACTIRTINLFANILGHKRFGTAVPFILFYYHMYVCFHKYHERSYVEPYFSFCHAAMLLALQIHAAMLPCCHGPCAMRYQT